MYLKKNYYCFTDVKGDFWYLLFLVSFLGMLFLSPVVMAQNKKKLTPAEYGRWGQLSFGQLSSKGKWISYQMDQSQHSDTLFVKSVDGKKTYRFMTSATGRFCGEQVFAFLDEVQNLRLLNLKTGEIGVINGVDSFTFSTDEKYLLTHEKDVTSSPLTIRSLDGGIRYRLENVVSYSHNPSTDEVACFVSEPHSKKVLLISLKDFKTKRIVAEQPSGFFSHFVWQPDGGNLAFMYEQDVPDDEVKANVVCYYDQKRKETYTFYNKQLQDFAEPTRIADAIMSRLTVSPDGSKVLFGVEAVAKEVLFPRDSLQIWNGDAATVFPEQRFRNEKAGVPDMVAWQPLANTFIRINDSKKAMVFFNGTYDYALSYDPDAIGGQYKLHPDSDYYITDLNTGNTKLWLRAFSTEKNDMSISPDGKYIGYYRHHNYWVYNFKEETHTNLTEKLGIQWYDDDVLGVPDNYGIVGWSEGSDTLFVYDEWDLWAVPTHGSGARRLTNGYKDSYRYRLVNTEGKSTSSTFDREKAALIVLHEPLIFHFGNGIVNGYKVLDENGKWHSLASGAMSFSTFRKAAKSSTYAFITQRFDSSPDIRVVDAHSKEAKIVAKSNVFQNDYYWGRTEVIDYQNQSGVRLKGVLYYPAVYDAAKKYPMVVSIYDKQLAYLYNYLPPSLENIIGFNITDYTLNGYFVLRPDIIYERNDPGISAADCTLAATHAVLEKGIVDEDGVGLIGHSFGGYETNFIVTQTDLFRTAVSGAGISDLTSFYLSIGWSMGKPEIFRFEHQQWRMDYPLFEDFESYARNNPIANVKDIVTPLLLWTGEKDDQVNYYQSIRMHLALRRLGKPTTLLVYPNEGHAIVTPHFQKDLSLKIHEWFDYYLKKGKSKEWIGNGTK